MKWNYLILQNWVKDLRGLLSKEDIQMANMDLKKVLNIIRQKYSKSQGHVTSHLIEWLLLKTQGVTHGENNVEKELSYTTRGNVNSYYWWKCK